MTRALFLFLLATFGLSACVSTNNKYSWGGYENSLYAYYKDSSKAAELIVALEATINSAEQTQQPVPPGIYAEYGYLLLQQGKNKEAIANFEKEKNKWPESAMLMDTMVRLASSNNKQKLSQNTGNSQ